MISFPVVFIIITLTIGVFICYDFYDLNWFLSVPYFNIFLFNLTISEFSVSFLIIYLFFEVIFSLLLFIIIYRWAVLLAVGVGCWWVRADRVEPAALICCCCFGRIVPLMMGSGIICRWAATSRCDPVCDLHWDWNWLQIRAEPGNICQINPMQI